MSAAILLFLASGPFFLLGGAIWDLVMGLVTGVITVTPDSFSTGAWKLATGSIYPMMLSVGVMILNLSFLAGVFRNASDLKQNFTLEMLLGLFLKVLLANVLMQNGLSIMQGLFSAASGLTDAVGTASGSLAVLPDDMDVGTTFFGVLFGIIYFLIAAVSSGVIFMSVYGRFLSLYVMTACAPLAVPFLAGGQGVGRTADAFFRAFLGKCFEIVIIALFLAFGTKICRSITWGSLEGIGGVFDGFDKCLQNMFNMVITAASVKSADRFMQRVFGL